MANIEKIWINKVRDKIELRIDWDNDRHQAIMLKGTDPESVKDGFLEAAHLLNKEIRGGHL